MIVQIYSQSSPKVVQNCTKILSFLGHQIFFGENDPKVPIYIWKLFGITEHAAKFGDDWLSDLWE